VWGGRERGRGWSRGLTTCLPAQVDILGRCPTMYQCQGDQLLKTKDLARCPCTCIPSPMREC
jgi:hypothetical protein